jgi:preprotein translocase subunit SecG
MLTLIIILIILACFVLGFFVLIQNSKGGGLASNFAGSNQVMGVRKTADFLEKTTWTLAGVIMLLCFVVAFAFVKPEFSREKAKPRGNVEQPVSEEDNN